MQNDGLKKEAILENADLEPTGIVRGKCMETVQQKASMGDMAQLARYLSDKLRVKEGVVSFQHSETQ